MGIFDNLWLVTNTLSKVTINLLRDFKHSTIMVSQPHNSKLTIKLLQVFQTQYDYGLVTTQ
jgi:hypothetical protein